LRFNDAGWGATNAPHIRARLAAALRLPPNCEARRDYRDRALQALAGAPPPMCSHLGQDLAAKPEQSQRPTWFTARGTRVSAVPMSRNRLPLQRRGRPGLARLHREREGGRPVPEEPIFRRATFRPTVTPCKSPVMPRSTPRPLPRSIRIPVTARTTRGHPRRPVRRSEWPSPACLPWNIPPPNVRTRGYSCRRVSQRTRRLG
jgi:hypothetical protein